MQSKALLAGLAHLDLTTPFGLEDLRGGDATPRIGIEDGVDDVSTASLIFMLVIRW